MGLRDIAVLFVGVPEKREILKTYLGVTYKNRYFLSSGVEVHELRLGECRITIWDIPQHLNWHDYVKPNCWVVRVYNSKICKAPLDGNKQAFIELCDPKVVRHKDKSYDLTEFFVKVTI